MRNTSTLLIASILVALCLPALAKFTTQDVKCHVCKAVVSEIEEEVAKVDPKKKIDVSGFRLDANGNSVGKSVPMAKSELFLSEVLEKVCDKMDDYLRATYKKTGKFTLLKIMIDGKMNPESSEVDFVQDDDLNKSLGHYCLEFIENYEDIVMKYFKEETLNEHLDIKICSEESEYCNDAPIQEDYEFDDKDEL
ncbi:protein seele [Musca domestica]|uniref:Protein seele n=1 Tax=Musca domestica TaxID=7370 RepID=A0A1I8MAC8_MUSDO|nr:protein seele [Musca domestica]